ncbi:uncharacterized protein LOC110050574 [Orbicella faveolata]|uniref:uncharacterized protein LOC110050574 n=1 Tax=Orbicella faveolata TaxID=48498 RepID=UPI0009E23206|nr:uncharacterized protein LOC110050574 [Orbicella faveolata]
MAYPCLNCNNEVTNCQEAILCDSCNRWCHSNVALTLPAKSPVLQYEITKILLPLSKRTKSSKRTGTATTYWQCGNRLKKLYCSATVIENEGTFRLGKSNHSHPAEVGAAITSKILADVKKKATTNVFKPASAIVNKVLSERLHEGPCPSLPKPAHIARAANRHRQKLRPEDPTDLTFELRPDCIPDNCLQCNSRAHVWAG